MFAEGATVTRFLPR